MNIVKHVLNGMLLTEKVEQKQGLLEYNKTQPYKELKVVQIAASLETIVKVGDIVYVPKKAGTDVEINDKPYVTIDHREIILIL